MFSHLKFKLLTTIALSLSMTGCLSFSARVKTADAVRLPFFKNTANECYFLDEFMPTPDAMVTGRSGSMNLRYYSYAAASYKDWDEMQVVLSFYSNDDRCWSLFEEYYVDQ
jgi:hypothetical protein